MIGFPVVMKENVHLSYFHMNIHIMVLNSIIIYIDTVYFLSSHTNSVIITFYYKCTIL